MIPPSKPIQSLSLDRGAPPRTSYWIGASREELAAAIAQRRPQMRLPSTRTGFAFDGGFESEVSLRSKLRASKDRADRRRREVEQAGRFLRASASVLLLAVLLAAPVAAQTQSGPAVDKQALGEYGTTYWPYELDGDPATAEWIGMRAVSRGEQIYQVWRVLVARNGQLCHGLPFDPSAVVSADAQEFSVATVQPGTDGIYRLIVNGMRYYREISFTLPACGGR